MKMERGYPIYTVTPKAEAAILRGHPWVYDAEILNTEGETGNGGLVDVVSKKGRYLGTGFLSQQSKIRVRLISRNANDRFDAAFWRRKLQWAWVLAAFDWNGKELKNRWVFDSNNPGCEKYAADKPTLAG